PPRESDSPRLSRPSIMGPCRCADCAQLSLSERERLANEEPVPASPARSRPRFLASLALLVSLGMTLHRSPEGKGSRKLLGRGHRMISAIPPRMTARPSWL